MLDVVKRELNKALGRIRMPFRGRLTKTNTSPSVMLVQADALSGEKLQSVEQMQQYGLTSHMPNGGMFLAVPIGGKTTHSIVIATEHGSYRLRSLKEGEVALYDDQGQKVHLTRDGIVIDGGGKQVKIVNTPLVRMETDELQITGEVRDRCDSDGTTMNHIRSVYDSHNHPGDSGGSTGTPNQGMS